MLALLSDPALLRPVLERVEGRRAEVPEVRPIVPVDPHDSHPVAAGGVDGPLDTRDRLSAPLVVEAGGVRPTPGEQKSFCVSVVIRAPRFGLSTNGLRSASNSRRPPSVWWGGRCA